MSHRWFKDHRIRQYISCTLSTLLKFDYYIFSFTIVHPIQIYCYGYSHRQILIQPWLLYKRSCSYCTHLIFALVTSRCPRNCTIRSQIFDPVTIRTPPPADFILISHSRPLPVKCFLTLST